MLSLKQYIPIDANVRQVLLDKALSQYGLEPTEQNVELAIRSVDEFLNEGKTAITTSGPFTLAKRLQSYCRHLRDLRKKDRPLDDTALAKIKEERQIDENTPYQLAISDVVLSIVIPDNSMVASMRKDFSALNDLTATLKQRAPFASRVFVQTKQYGVNEESPFKGLVPERPPLPSSEEVYQFQSNIFAQVDKPPLSASMKAHVGDGETTFTDTLVRVKRRETENHQVHPMGTPVPDSIEDRQSTVADWKETLSKDNSLLFRPMLKVSDGSLQQKKVDEVDSQVNQLPELIAMQPKEVLVAALSKEEAQVLRPSLGRRAWTAVSARLSRMAKGIQHFSKSIVGGFRK